MLACIIVGRAKLLLEYNSPEDAFASMAVDAWKNGDNSQKYYPLEKHLEKFCVVVASSNNGAVENVSMGFPKADEVDQVWGANDSPSWTLRVICLETKARPGA
ncbi:DNA helicase related protein [Halomonas sp. HAL1]|nr:DNA helicase related protein [Halomonas sp. HAL1]